MSDLCTMTARDPRNSHDRRDLSQVSQRDGTESEGRTRDASWDRRRDRTGHLIFANAAVMIVEDRRWVQPGTEDHCDVTHMLELSVVSCDDRDSWLDHKGRPHCLSNVWRCGRADQTKMPSTCQRWSLLRKKTAKPLKATAPARSGIISWTCSMPRRHEKPCKYDTSLVLQSRHAELL